MKYGIFTVGRSHVSPPEWSSTTVPFNHPGVYEGIELPPELQEPWWPEKCPAGGSETTTFRHKYWIQKELKRMRILYTRLHKLRLCVVFPGFLVYMAYHYHWSEGQWLTFIFGPSVYAFTPIAASVKSQF